MDEVSAGNARSDQDQDAAHYHPPEVTHLGSLADLTQQKEVGLADGSTFLGLDQGSV